MTKPKKKRKIAAVPTTGDSGSTPAITRAAVGSVCIYDVTEGELEILKQGSPNSIFLNFAIFLLSAALTIFVTLMVTTTSQTVFIILVIVLFIALIGGAFLMILWKVSRNSFSATIIKIESRKKPSLEEQN